MIARTQPHGALRSYKTQLHLGTTKPLAKLANHIRYDHGLCRTPVGKLLGVGRSSLAKPEAMGMDTMSNERTSAPPAH